MKKKNKMFYGWIITAAGLLFATAGLGVRYSYGVFLVPLENEFSISRSGTSDIFSIYMLTCCITAIIGGWALDRYGPRVVSISMSFFTLLSLILTGLLPHGTSYSVTACFYRWAQERSIR